MLPLHGFSAPGEGIDDGEIVELANVILGACLKCLKHDPLVGKLPSHLFPFHRIHLQDL